MSRTAHAPLIPLLLAACLAACSQDTGTSDGDGSTAQAAGKPFGTQSHVQRAERIWSQQMSDYRTWSAYPGFDGWQDGQGPHGAKLKYFVNEVAAGDPTADGAVIVKENYSAERDDALTSVTIMKRIAGFAPDHADWFWVKYGPGGEVLENPKGLPLAGRVGVDEGCISCHSKARGDDYLFAND